MIHTKRLLDHTLCFCSLTSEVRRLVDRLRKKTYEEMFSTRESTYHLMNGNTYYRGEWGLKCHTCRPHEAIPLVRMTQTLLMDDRVTPSVPKKEHEVTFWNYLYSFYSVRNGKYVSIELYISNTFVFLTNCLHFIGRYECHCGFSISMSKDRIQKLLWKNVNSLLRR